MWVTHAEQVPGGTLRAARTAGSGLLLAAALALESLPDDGAAFLQIAVGERLDGVVEAEARFHARHVELPCVRVEAELGGNAFAMGVREVHRDLGDLPEDVEIGRQRRDGTVE